MQDMLQIWVIKLCLCVLKLHELFMLVAMVMALFMLITCLAHTPPKKVEPFPAPPDDGKHAVPAFFELIY